MLRPGGAGARLPAKHQAERPAGRGSGETLRYNLQSLAPGFPDTDSEDWLPSWKVSGFNRFYHFPPLRPHLRTDYWFPTVPPPGTPQLLSFTAAFCKRQALHLGPESLINQTAGSHPIGRERWHYPPPLMKLSRQLGALKDRSTHLIVPTQSIVTDSSQDQNSERHPEV